MPGPSVYQPVRPVTFYNHLNIHGGDMVILPPGPTADFPAGAIVSVNPSGQAVEYDSAIHNVAVAHEGVDDGGLNVEAGPHLFVARKSQLYVILIKDRLLVMTAGYTGSTPIPLDPTHIGDQFELYIDPTTGYTAIDLTTAGSGPFTIRRVLSEGRPEDSFWGLPDDYRVNARVVVEVDPAIVYAP